MGYYILIAIKIKLGTNNKPANIKDEYFERSSGNTQAAMRLIVAGNVTPCKTNVRKLS